MALISKYTKEENMSLVAMVIPAFYTVLIPPLFFFAVVIPAFFTVLITAFLLW